MRSKAAKGSGCIGTTDDPSSWDSPLALNSTDKWRSGSGSGASYVAPWEIIFELVRVSRADRVPPPPSFPPPLFPSFPPPLFPSAHATPSGAEPLRRGLAAAAQHACSSAAARQRRAAVFVQGDFREERNGGYGLRMRVVCVWCSLEVQRRVTLCAYWCVCEGRAAAAGGVSFRVRAAGDGEQGDMK